MPFSQFEGLLLLLGSSLDALSLLKCEFTILWDSWLPVSQSSVPKFVSFISVSSELCVLHVSTTGVPTFWEVGFS